MRIKTRTGKIARLPRGTREQLNRRLENGERGSRLVEWLNSLPEVQRVVAADFEGEPVSESNVSRWRKGGYADWLEQQESLESVQRMAEDGPELAKAAKGPLSDHTAVWLLARELAAFKRLRTEEGGGENEWKRLREFCNDLVRLRRGDQRSRRLALEEERWERKREAEEAEQAAKGPADWQLTDEEREDRIREIYGLPPIDRSAGGRTPEGEDGEDGAPPSETSNIQEDELPIGDCQLPIEKDRRARDCAPYPRTARGAGARPPGENESEDGG
jgi:hypothetical protein